MKTCDGCTACCDGTLNIEELNVYWGSPCENICDSGCAIYQNRPKVCSDFRCQWLDDKNLPDWMKPSDSGLLIKYSEKRRTLYLISVYQKTIEPSILLYAFSYAYKHNLFITCYFDDTKGYHDIMHDRVRATFKFSNYKITK